MVQTVFGSLVCLLWLVGMASGGYKFRELGSFPLDGAAFSFVGGLTPKEAPALLLTTFSANPFSWDSVYLVSNLGAQLKNVSQIAPVTVSSHENWPNEMISAYPLLGTPSLVVAGGFLVPGHSTGQIDLYQQETSGSFSGPFKISTDKSEYFYHRTIAVDLDGDGLQDILTARAIKPLVYGDAGGQLLWYKNPGPGSAQLQPWPHTVLLPGPDAPDIFFRFHDIDADGVPELLAAQYFTAKFSVYYLEDPQHSSWAAPGRIGRVDVATGKPGFDLQLVDLNNDGALDVLITFNSADPATSSMWGFEIPANGAYKTQPWPAHRLSDPIKTRKSGVGAGSPGAAVAFWPASKMQGRTKPWILLSGDDAYAAWMFKPVSESTSDWRYQNVTIVESSGTVGAISVSDVDGDGLVEFYVPQYDASLVTVFQFYSS